MSSVQNTNYHYTTSSSYMSPDTVMHWSIENWPAFVKSLETTKLVRSRKFPVDIKFPNGSTFCTWDMELQILVGGSESDGTLVGICGNNHGDSNDLEEESSLNSCQIRSSVFMVLLFSDGTDYKFKTLIHDWLTIISGKTRNNLMSITRSVATPTIQKKQIIAIEIVVKVTLASFDHETISRTSNNLLHTCQPKSNELFKNMLYQQKYTDLVLKILDYKNPVEQNTSELTPIINSEEFTEIHVHKAIMCSASDYIASILPITEGKSLIICEDDGLGMMYLVDYIYTGSLNLDTKLIQESIKNIKTTTQVTIVNLSYYDKFGALPIISDFMSLVTLLNISLKYKVDILTKKSVL